MVTTAPGDQQSKEQLSGISKQNWHEEMKNLCVCYMPCFAKILTFGFILELYKVLTNKTPSPTTASSIIPISFQFLYPWGSLWIQKPDLQLRYCGTFWCKWNASTFSLFFLKRRKGTVYNLTIHIYHTLFAASTLAKETSNLAFSCQYNEYVSYSTWTQHPENGTRCDPIQRLPSYVLNTLHY